MLHGIERSPEAVHVIISTLDAPFVARLGNPLPDRFIGAIESHLVDQFFARTKELCLFPFFKQASMLVGSIGQKQTAACGDFEGARRMLVWPDLAQKTDTNLSACKRTCVIVSVN